jgi:heme/copper-type cytochrome/quinol oxidase subunit 2
MATPVDPPADRSILTPAPPTRPGRRRPPWPHRLQPDPGQVEDELRWPGLALLLLSVAIVLLVLVVQFTFRARQYARHPNQAKSGGPISTTTPDASNASTRN